MNLKVLVICLTCLLHALSADAQTRAVHVTGPYQDSTAPGGGEEFNSASASVSIAPASTQWIAWNHFSTLQLTRGGERLLGSDAPFDLGVNDFIRMTIRNPVGDALTVDIDENDTQAQPFGTQAVLYGSSAMSPNVFRQSPITGQEFILDEAGSHTAIFTTAGTYDFEFSFRNEFLGTINAQNPDVWILIQESSDVVPEPATILVWSVLVTVGIFLRRRKRRPC